jgi:hypothetical protein
MASAFPKSPLGVSPSHNPNTVKLTPSIVRWTHLRLFVLSAGLVFGTEDMASL